MEYDYQLLNPPAFSTQSINFKLTETRINSQNILTPVRPQQSLTYTISLQSLHQSDFSPLKNLIPQPIEPSTDNKQEQIKLEETERGSLLQQMNLSERKAKTIAQHKDRKQSNCNPNNEFEETKLPRRKSILRVHNLEYQVISTEESIIHNEDLKIRNRMGKVLTKVHTVVKENRTPFISRPTSLIKIVKSSHDKYQRKHSIKSISKRIEDIEKQSNGEKIESVYLKKRQKVLSLECNRKQKRQNSYDDQRIVGLKEMGWCDRALKNRFDVLDKNGFNQKLRYSNPEAGYDKVEETLKNETIVKNRNEKRRKIFSTHNPNIDNQQVQNRSRSYLLKKKSEACESNILMENKNSIKINKNSLLIESVKVNFCQRLGNANGQDQKKKYFSNKEGIARSQKRPKQKEQIIFSNLDTQGIMLNNAQSGWRKLKTNFTKKMQ